MIDQRYMTHLPSLFSALLGTTGAVLEVGAGTGSTPMLRAFCDAAERRFVSLESNLDYALLNGSTYDADYARVPELAKEQWGVVFVDHAPEEDRLRVANLFRLTAQLIVVHDWSSADTNGHGSVDQFRRYKVDTRFFPTTITLEGGAQ